MDGICRLCLSASEKDMCKLTEGTNIIRMIRTCLCVEIMLNDASLPNQICKGCSAKVEEIYKFHEFIKNNECKLLLCLNNGTIALQKFYNEIKGKLNNYLDTNMKVFNIEHYVKTEKYLKNNETDVVNSINMTIQSKNDQKVNKIIFPGDIKEEVESIENRTAMDIYKDHDSCDSNSVLPPENKETEVQQNGKKKKDSVVLNNITDSSTCLMCFKILDSQIDLIKHYYNEHGGDDEKSKFIVAKTGKNMSYYCNICHKEFDSKKNIIKHLTTHKSYRPFICKICGRTYRTVSQILSHKRAHINNKLECSYRCGFTTAYNGSLRDHEKRHLEDFKFKCEICDKGFFVKTWFDQHQNIHKGIKPYACDQCGLAFHMERYLTSHRSTVHPQTLDLKRYMCVHCSLPCDTAKSLADHLKEHGIKTDYLCDECGNTYKNADQLRNHKYTHLQRKPFTCSICSKSFAKKWSLRLHEAAHSGERKHACDSCGKRYVQKSTLDRHRRKDHAASSPKSQDPSS